MANDRDVELAAMTLIEAMMRRYPDVPHVIHPDDMRAALEAVEQSRARGYTCAYGGFAPDDTGICDECGAPDGECRGPKCEFCGGWTDGNYIGGNGDDIPIQHEICPPGDADE